MKSVTNCVLKNEKKLTKNYKDYQESKILVSVTFYVNGGGEETQKDQKGIQKGIFLISLQNQRCIFDLNNIIRLTFRTETKSRTLSIKLQAANPMDSLKNPT